MPRSLSDPEYAYFLNDINLDSMNLPPWGGVIQWGSQFVLVYKPDGASEWLLTDISDGIPSGDQLVDVQTYTSNVPKQETSYYDVWKYEFSKSFIQDLGELLKDLSKTVGSTAANALGPLLESLKVPLIVVGLAVAFYYIPRRSS